MPRKHICSCGAPQFKGESIRIPRSEDKGSLHHEFEEKFYVWICEFCEKKEKVLAGAMRRSNGINPPRKSTVTQYAPTLNKISQSHGHIRTRTFIRILESYFPGRSPKESLDDMLLEGIIQIDYNMKNVNRDSFIPMRIRLNPTFKLDILEILEELKGLEPIEAKIERVKHQLSVVDFQTTNPQSKKIISVLKAQQEQLSNNEIPFFVCGSKKCQVRKDNNRYEILLKLLIALLENIRNEDIVISSDFSHSIEVDGLTLSEYKSELKSILGSRLIFFGILKDIEPLYIPPSKIPKEAYTEIELFETNLRDFVKISLLNHYTQIRTVIFGALKTIFRGKSWDNINNKMIKDLESDYEKTNNPSIRNALNVAKRSQSYNQLLFDRFFEAMVMGDIIKIIAHEWNPIFSKALNPFAKDDILTKLKIIKGDRNIKAHPKSRIPTIFQTLTCIYEFEILLSLK